jgi:anti-sigma regulatory factor (Ser/Thr protein kinase)
MQAYARFGRSADQIPEARAFVRETLFRWGETSVVNDALLVTSELFTNAVVHGSGRIDIYVTLDPGALRIAVVDDGRRIPHPWPRRGATPLGGRGLRIVDAVASTWGDNLDPVGRTRVWAEMVREQANPVRKLRPADHSPLSSGHQAHHRRGGRGADDHHNERRPPPGGDERHRQPHGPGVEHQPPITRERVDGHERR